MTTHTLQTEMQLCLEATACTFLPFFCPSCFHHHHCVARMVVSGPSTGHFTTTRMDQKTGYNLLADRIGTFPELAVFRRFLELNAKDLLCLQAEIINHESELRRVIEADRNAEGKSIRREFECDISALKGPDSHKTPSDSLQWEMTLELRKLLREYSKAHHNFPLSHHS